MSLKFLYYFFLLNFSLPGCGSVSPDLNKEVEYVRKLLLSKNCDLIYKSLSSEKRQQIGYEEFVTDCTSYIELNRKEIEDLNKILLVGKRKNKKGKNKKQFLVIYRATITLGENETIEMVYEEGKWRVDSFPENFYPRFTPRETIRSFVRAFKLRRWDILATMMPSNYTGQDDAKILEEHWGKGEERQRMEMLVMLLEDHLEDEIITNENRATLIIAPGHGVEMMREGGVWVISKIY